MTTLFNATQLLELANTAQSDQACASCAPLVCPGWESLPSVFDPNILELVGTLRDETAEESWDEFHPEGTQIWSAEAPIAPKFHPYNKCNIYRCAHCTRLFLRYTEYGGYYVDERIRELKANLIAAESTTS